MTAYAYYASRPHCPSPISTFPSQAMPNYSKDFLQQRNSRTLSMRRPSPFLTIANFKKFESNVSNRPNILDLRQESIEEKTFCDILNSNDESKILELLNSIISISPSERLSGFLYHIKNSIDAAEIYGQTLSNSESIKLTQTLMASLICSFPVFSSDCKECIMSSEISLRIDFLLHDFSQKVNSNSLSSDDINFLLLVCKLINVICEQCEYGRDSFLCYDIHGQIIEMLTTITTAITESAISPQTEEILCSLSSSIYAILGNKLYNVDNLDQQLNEEMVTNLIQLALKLIKISHNSLRNIASTLNSILINYTNVINVFFQNKVYLAAIQMMENPELMDISLILIGNMSALGEKNAILTLIQDTTNGETSLFNEFVKLIQSEYASLALWNLSNLLQTLPDMFLPQINQSLITYLIDISETSNFQVKKEASFFLATVIISGPIELAIKFTESQTLIDVFSEILDCDDKKVIIRCLIAIARMVKAIELQKGASAVCEFFNSGDFGKQLDNLSHKYTDIMGFVSSFQKYASIEEQY